jgi:hypothetical protein
MKKGLQFARMLLLLMLAFSFQNSFARVTLTANSGTATGSFTTLKVAIDDVNSGTRKGIIVIKSNASINKTAAASLTANSAETSSTLVQRSHYLSHHNGFR